LGVSVNTDQSLQLSLCLADYKITEVVVVPRGSRPSTELSSSDIPALQQRNNDETRNGGSSAASSGSGSGGVLSSLLKRNKSVSKHPNIPLPPVFIDKQRLNLIRRDRFREFFQDY